MARTAVILRSAQFDFQTIRDRVLAQFGAATWQSVNKKHRAAIRRLLRNPQLGSRVEALEQFGETGFRKLLVAQTWIIFEFDDERLIVYMFLAARQDFVAHLEARVMRS